MNKIRATYRFSFFLVTAVWTVMRIMVSLKLDKQKGQDYILEVRRKWVRYTIKRVGVKLDMKGVLPEIKGPAIIVQNHKSYFDPMIALRLVKAMPVSKAEVSSWPLIGYLADYTGVLFVQREDRQSRKDTLTGMEKELKKGNNILIYPEGTTTADSKTLQFKLGSFRLAAKLGVPVIPMSIEFSKDEDSWIGTDMFLPHFFKTFGKKEVYIKASVGPPMYGDDPEKLLDEAQQWIDADILKLRKEFAAEGIARD